MITPLIHRVLTREDLARLVAEIGRVDQAGARAAEQAVQAGEVDAVLDSAAALEAVRGRGGAPAAGPWLPCALARPTRPRRCTPRWRKRGATTWAGTSTAPSAGSSGFSPGLGRARPHRRR